MIIPCAQCHTRFKVPDGKVTARGLKVRCSRCGHTFRVFPGSGASEAADPAPAASRPSAPDPFRSFAPEGASEMEKTPARGTQVSALLAQMAPAGSAEDFDVDVAGEPAPSTEPAWNFPPPPARPVRAAPATAAAVALAPERLEPEPDLAPIPVRPLPPADTAVPPPAEDTATAAALDAFEDDPFATPMDRATSMPEPPGPAYGEIGFDEPPAEPAPPPRTPEERNLAALAGFTPAWGVAAPVRALSVDGTVASHVSSLAPAPEPESPPPPPQFGGAGTVLDDLPSLESLGPPEAALADTGPEPQQMPDWRAPAGGPSGLELELSGDMPSLELEAHPPATPAPDPAWAAAPLRSPPPASPAAALSWEDPFSAAPAPGPATPPPRPPSNSVLLDEAPAPNPGTAAPDHGFFEMPTGATPGRERAAASPDELLPDVPHEAEPAAIPQGSQPVFSAPMASISKPPGRTRLGLRESEQPGTARRVSGVLLNVGLAALLLLVVVGLASSWATSGRVEGAALSPRRLLQVVRPGSGVSPVEVTPGTYETRSGRSLLYVRGRVLNRGAPAARVRVRAEVWDGAQAVKTGETLAGAIATPEELWRAVTPAEVEALRARLLAAATPVKDGQQADFLVLLDEAPPDISGLRLRVSATLER